MVRKNVATGPAPISMTAPVTPGRQPWESYAPPAQLPSWEDLMRHALGWAAQDEIRARVLLEIAREVRAMALQESDQFEALRKMMEDLHDDTGQP